MLGMEECCRICLGQAPQRNSVHISYKITINKTISQVINEFSSVQVSEHDLFPKYICSKCYQQLLVVHDFRELIFKSDCYLKQKLTNFAQLYDNSVGQDNVLVKLIQNTTDSTLKDNLKNRAQTNTDVLEIKCEDQKNLGINAVNLNLQQPDTTLSQEDVCVKSEDSVDDVESCKDNQINATENSIQSNKSQTKRKSIDCQHECLNDSINESQTHVKQEIAVRVKPGRKPSTVSKSKRKVLEFKCDICNKVLFGRSNRLKLHIITAHSEIKNFECESCSKRFKSKQQLVNHTRVHTGEKPYHCDVCKKKFTSVQNLFNHKKKHTGQHKTYKCESCEKGYSTPGELETHKRIVHTGEKPFLCEICSRAYSSARNLRLHIRSVHEKNEKCPKCGLMLSCKRIKQHVQKHQDKEDGLRRYTCDKCGKGFFNLQALKKHQVVHTGERPYSCQICHKSFNQKSGVDTHMRTHSDVRSFCCGLCAKTFKYKQHCQLHMKKKHNSSHDGTKLATETNETKNSSLIHVNADIN